jgi:4-hydroxy-3-methylbut-2-enyl diphosphate reductase
MKIHLAQSAGLCFGVTRAITTALHAARSGKPVYMLGDIVHNEDVVRSIENAGITKISRLRRVENKILLIRAHGTSRSVIAQARRYGFRIIDATCPMVKEIHRIAQTQEKKGYSIIIIGDKKHEEVQGIAGNLMHPAIIIEDARHIPAAKLAKLRRACIVAQSTQNLDKIEQIVDIVGRHVADCVFYNTVCKPTRAKQDEIKKMPAKNDVMIIIGSKKSANTKRLYEISKAQNTRSYWINSNEELKAAWFRGVKNVGITAGASTPDETIKRVIGHIQAMAIQRP